MFAAPGFFNAGIVDTANQTVHQFSQELRIASPAGQFVEYTGGLYYFRSETDRTFTRTTSECVSSTLPVDPVIGFAPCNIGAAAFDNKFATADFEAITKNFAIFGQATVNVLDDLRLMIGGRFTSDDVDYDFRRFSSIDGTSEELALTGGDPNVVAVFGPGIRTRFTRSDSVDNTNFSFKAGIQYDVLPNIMTYFSYTQGYKGPAFNLFFNFRPGTTNAIDAETADAFEAGVKSSLFGDRLVLNLAGYFAEYDNFQANNFVNDAGITTTSLTNAGVVTTAGFEMDFIARPLTNVSLFGGLAYTDAKVKKFFILQPNPTPEQITAAQANEGTPLPFAPDWKLNIAAEYVFDLAQVPFDIILNSQYNYQTEVLSNIFVQDVENSIFRIDGYGIWNASIRFQTKEEDYSLAFHVKNILDTSYLTTVSGGFGAGARIQVPRDADRYWGLSLRARF
ncbi:MAG: TonB-dependent receptor [Alphaproteobacteria bacterium]|nr:MAG: TonB-dependent receptor [Alphaproteobacteria bacterium]